MGEGGKDNKGEALDQIENNDMEMNDENSCNDMDDSEVEKIGLDKQEQIITNSNVTCNEDEVHKMYDNFTNDSTNTNRIDSTNNTKMVNNNSTQIISSSLDTNLNSSVTTDVKDTLSIPNIICTSFEN